MIALLAVAFLNLCGILLKRRWNMGSAESYCVALLGALAVLYVGGIFNLLFPVTVGVFAAIVVWLVFTVKKASPETEKRWVDALNVRGYFSPLVLLNNLFCVVFAVIFSVSKPLFYYWDEFSFWGTSAKATKLFDRLYSIWPTPLDYDLPPANALLSYFFSFFSADFQPYLLLLSYAFLFFAVFALAAELAYCKSGSLPFAVITYVLLVLSPFMSVAHTASLNYETLLYAYGTAMIDFNIAVVFLSGIALYLANPEKKWYLLSVAFLVNMKNTGVFFALLAVCVVACFRLFDAQKEKRLQTMEKTAVWMLLVIAVAYGSWQVHVKAFELKAAEPVVLQDAAYLEEDAAVVRVDEAINSNALAIVVPSLRSEKYNTVLATMREGFLQQKTNLFLPDRYFVVALVVAGVLVSLFSGQGKRLRALCISVGVGVGCYVYAVTISYFISYFTDGMVEYSRYMSSYYFLWMYVLVLLALTDKRARRGKQAVFCAVSLLALYMIGKTGLDYTVINAPDTPYLEYMQTQQDVQPFLNVLEKGDRVYLVLPDQDTWGYMELQYHLMPAICNIDTKGTGIDFTVSFREALDADSSRRYYNLASPEQYAQLMAEYFDYVLVVQPDAEFKNSYAELFSDGMTEGTLYKVTEQAVPMQVVLS